MTKELIRREIVQVLSDLPEFCFSRLNTTGAPIIIKRGSIGYYETHPKRDVERANAELTAAQVEAMEAGSHFGFDCPGADPLNYPELAGAAAYHADLRAKWLAAMSEGI